jgi:hypothetical protein
MGQLLQENTAMRIRLVLPVIVESEEERLANMIGRDPDKFECEDAIFYQIENIIPHEKYNNLCHVCSGGAVFTVAKSMKQVDEMIRVNMIPLIGAN